MYKYTLAFLIRDDEVLLLNRNKSPWMGAWNGVGGKIHDNETAKDCVLREIFEETGIKINEKDLLEKGSVTWNTFDADGNGLYLFVTHLPHHMNYPTPRVVDEGILDWKKIVWAIDKNNQGIAKNIPYFLDIILKDEMNYEFKCTFNGDNLVSVKAVKL